MNQIYPLPDHPEFSVVDYPGCREYRVENFCIVRDGSGRTVKTATGLSWHCALFPILFSLTQIFGPWWLVFWALVVTALFYAKCTQVIVETVIIIPPHGIQLETHRGLPYWPRFVSRRFIPLTNLQDVIINEALRGWNVRYYLAVVKGRPSVGFSLEVAFENILPRMPVLLEVYHGIHETLLDRRMNEHGEEG